MSVQVPLSTLARTVSTSRDWRARREAMYRLAQLWPASREPFLAASRDDRGDNQLFWFGLAQRLHDPEVDLRMAEMLDHETNPGRFLTRMQELRGRQSQTVTDAVWRVAKQRNAFARSMAIHALVAIEVEVQPLIDRHRGLYRRHLQRQVGRAGAGKAPLGWWLRAELPELTDRPLVG